MKKLLKFRIKHSYNKLSKYCKGNQKTKHKRTEEIKNKKRKKVYIQKLKIYF